MTCVVGTSEQTSLTRYNVVMFVCSRIQVTSTQLISLCDCDSQRARWIQWTLAL